MLKNNQLYERLIDLSIKVLEGKVDPLDVDISKYLDSISSLFKKLKSLDDIIKDIRALYGLTIILSCQYELLKSRGLGLYIEPILVELRTQQLSIEAIAEILRSVWTPVVEIEVSDNILIEYALDYFNKLKPIDERKIKHIVYELPKAELTRDFIIPLNIHEKLDELYQELIFTSKGKWVDYYNFINSKGNPVERAYLLSFLITEGRVVMMYRRFEDKIYVKPVENIVVENLQSVATWVRRSKVEG